MPGPTDKNNVKNSQDGYVALEMEHFHAENEEKRLSPSGWNAALEAGAPGESIVEFLLIRDIKTVTLLSKSSFKFIGGMTSKQFDAAFRRQFGKTKRELIKGRRQQGYEKILATSSYEIRAIVSGFPSAPPHFDVHARLSEFPVGSEDQQEALERTSAEFATHAQVESESQKVMCACGSCTTCIALCHFAGAIIIVESNVEFPLKLLSLVLVLIGACCCVPGLWGLSDFCTSKERLVKTEEVLQQVKFYSDNSRGTFFDSNDLNAKLLTEPKNEGDLIRARILAEDEKSQDPAEEQTRTSAKGVQRP